jgi:hypothetical protein
MTEDRSRIVALGRSRENEKPTLLIGGSPTEYGQFADGTYFLQEDAYRWSKDLLELGRERLAYLDRIATLEARRAEGGDGNA